MISIATGSDGAALDRLGIPRKRTAKTLKNSMMFEHF
jgi:hypothetical protein